MRRRNPRSRGSESRQAFRNVGSPGSGRPEPWPQGPPPAGSHMLCCGWALVLPLLRCDQARFPLGLRCRGPALRAAQQMWGLSLWRGHCALCPLTCIRLWKPPLPFSRPSGRGAADTRTLDLSLMECISQQGCSLCLGASVSSPSRHRGALHPGAHSPSLPHLTLPPSLC